MDLVPIPLKLTATANVQSSTGHSRLKHKQLSLVVPKEFRRKRYQVCPISGYIFAPINALRAA